ncbi:MAG: hypothetical protein ABIT76_05465 [Chthoniobacterales bacterium]
MSDLNDPLKESYIGKVADALGPYTADLTAKGFDPASRITQLSGAGGLIESAGRARKTAEKAAIDAVKHEKDLREQFYKLSTDTVSLVEGLLSKDHELTVKLRGLRSGLIGAQTPSAPSAPATPQTP